ncbi:MAG: stage II sporulation protein D [Clostridia bacterium]|nr:stage II sporulation protein D [Clostridia bacterium]MBQ9737765.1 stage II sporulation protein D [Clostridia bacterium]
MKKGFLCLVLLFFVFTTAVPVLVGLCFFEDLSGVKDWKVSTPPIISYLDITDGLVKTAEIEEYLVGVLAAEMPAEYGLEALKAQAVAARSYIARRMDEKNAHHPDAAVCTDSTHCKAYISEKEAKARWTSDKKDEYWEKLKSAVDATNGEVMICEEEVAEAFFFAGSGGRTENSEEVWGEARPYLKSVESPWEEDLPQLLSVRELSNKEVRSILEAAGKNLKSIEGKVTIAGLERTEGGSVKTVEIDGVTLKGSEARKLFDLKSANFSVEARQDGVIFNVKGSGHGVGMSQIGANYMSKNGKKYTEILSHYYTNIQITKLWGKKSLF